MAAQSPTFIVLAAAAMLSACEPPQGDTTEESVTALELLSDVPSDLARRLEQYNAVFLQRAGYFATRHRIVAVDTDALGTAEKVVIRPFADVQPTILTRNRVHAIGGLTFWNGQQDESSDTTLVMEAWAVEPTGLVNKAVTSAGTLATDFRSLQGAVFDRRDGTAYEIKPLQFTPKYSVVLDIGRDLPLIPIDTVGQNPPYVTQQARLTYRRYMEAMDALPSEDGKLVLAEAP
jgi:hypothetical protein